MAIRFLGTIKSDSKNILSFILPNVHFTLLDIINNQNSKKVFEFFDNLENTIRTETFKDLIPVILTDRDLVLMILKVFIFLK